MPHRILVVDDDPLFLRTLSKSLTESGFLVNEAASAGESVRMAEQFRPDLMLVDVVLPDESGVEVCRKIKSSEALADTFVVLITAFQSGSETRIEGLDAGADAYIVRPIGFRELVARLQALLRLQTVQSALRNAGAELERVVQERTQELVAANARLRIEIEQRQAAEARYLQAQRLESAGRLAAGLAHDFNNLLTIIACNAALLRQDRRIPTDAEDMLRDIAMAVDRGAALTQRLLMFTRRQVIQPRVINLNHTIQTLESMLTTAVGAGIELQLRLAPELPSIFADPGMIEQVILNLAVNARDAMPRGGKLRLQTDVLAHELARAAAPSEAGDGDHVRLTVSDTGCGMDDATREKIFEAFYTTKEPGKGSGLGLSTVYGIVRQHNGWIDVESRLGEGATFRIHFPAHAREGVAPSPAAATLPSREAGETILLVEDQPEVRSAACAILRSDGYRVLVAASGVVAKQLWKAHKNEVDLLLTDIAMPDGISGWDLAEHVRQEKPDVRVLLVSGCSPESARGGHALPTDCQFLQKPFNSDSLLKAVRECLDVSQGSVP